MGGLLVSDGSVTLTEANVNSTRRFAPGTRRTLACHRRRQSLALQWSRQLCELEASDHRRQALRARRARPDESSLHTLEA